MNKPRLPFANCSRCPLSRIQGNGPVPMSGATRADLIFIGEAPGFEETVPERGEKYGKPFVGPSGRLLKSLIEKHNTQGLSVAFTNVVACRPPENRDPSDLEINCCSGRLKAELDSQPEARRVILGTVANRAFFGNQYPVSKFDGSWIDDRNFISYHPSFILRQPTAARSFDFSIKMALNTPQPLFSPRVDYDIVDIPPVDLHGMIAVDIETTGKRFRRHQITCISIANSEDRAFIVPQATVYSQKFISWLRDLFSNPNVVIVGHNFKFDAGFLIHHLGVDFPVRLLDTMLLHYALNEEGLSKGKGGDLKDNKSVGHGLKLLLRRFFGVRDYKFSGDWKNANPSELYPYAAIDSTYTLKLARRLLELAKAEPRSLKLYTNLLRPAAQELCYMELNGAGFDTAYSQELGVKFKTQQNTAIKEMQLILTEKGYVGANTFRPSAVGELRRVLYELFSLPIRRTDKGQLSTDTNSLAAFAELVHNEDDLIYNFIMYMFEYKKLQKMYTTYVGGDVLNKKGVVVKRVGLLADVVDGILYPTFNLQAVITGRLSADRVHQIPRKSSIHPVTKKKVDIGKDIKNQFIPLRPDHVLLNIDWSQMELRILAWASLDQGMIDAFNNDLDLHTETAIAIFGQEFLGADESTKTELRTKAKNFNFGVAYGMTENTVANDWWKAMTPEQRARTTFTKVQADAKEFFRKWFAARPGVAKWQRWFVGQTFKTKYIETQFGRKREIVFIPEDQRSQAELRNHVMNFPIQGMASDCTLHSLIRVSQKLRELNWPVFPMMTVHDSIVFSCHQDYLLRAIQLCRQIMLDTAIEFFGTIVKFQVDFEVGHRWGSLKKEEDWFNGQT